MQIPNATEHSAPKLAPNAVPNGTLLALDVATGKTVWKNDTDIWGTQIAVSAKHGTLLMNYKAVRHNFFELPSEVGRVHLACRHPHRSQGLGTTSEVDPPADQRRRDSTLKAERRYQNRSATAVGIQTLLRLRPDLSSRNLLLLPLRHARLRRSLRTEGTENYGGIRPSCWIDASSRRRPRAPVPDGSSKCQCSYQMKAWFALQGEWRLSGHSFFGCEKHIAACAFGS